ncbi:Metallo-dependent phosphatase-like protein [Phycomyces nitens]|nr:Metallo-dependent phosphatase-like protein [Phycomyces nitens]
MVWNTRLSPSTLFCLAITFIGFLRACILYRDSTKSLYPSKTLDNQVIDLAKKVHDPLVIGPNPSNLLYFIQVSDLHISRFKTKGHTQNFLHFVQSSLPTIKPEFVVVTGDLTDAKEPGGVTSYQSLDEWKIYKQAIDEKGSNVPWYDMRGNHDCFNMASWSSDQNLYRKYGKSASLMEQGQGVYSWDSKKSFGQYKFIAADACPKKGPARPFNFFGYMTSSTMDRLESEARGSYNHTFLFVHYPTTTVLFGTSSAGHTYQDIAGHISVYFCGHLHRLAAGLGDVLKSYDSVSDTLELEVADLKDHGVYRIVAIDHDLVSFVDVELPMSQMPPFKPSSELEWPEPITPPPIVLITNPKDAQFVLSREPTSRIGHSTHIRTLVFSEYSPDQLKVRLFVDGNHHPFPAVFVGNSSMPLWVSSWEANDFDDMQTHKLVVQVTAPDGQVGQSEVLFRVDLSRLYIKSGIVGKLVMKGRLSTTLRTLTLLAVVVLLSLLLVTKVWADIRPLKGDRILLEIHGLDQVDQSPYQGLYRQWLLWYLRFVRLPQVDILSWCVCWATILSLVCLPWFRAEFIPTGETANERLGTFYMWGLVLNQQWIPLSDTWMYSTMHFCDDIAVFVLLFAWRTVDSADLYCRGSYNTSNRPRQLYERAWFKGLEIVYLLWRISELVALAAFYGGFWPYFFESVLWVWSAYVGYVLLGGKHGLLQRRFKSDRIGVVLEGCPGCLEGTNNLPVPPSLESQRNGEDEEAPLIPHLPEATGLSSGITSSSPLLDSAEGPVQVKSRKRGTRSPTETLAD